MVRVVVGRPPYPRRVVPLLSNVPLVRTRVRRARGGTRAAGLRQGYAAERALAPSRVHLQQLSEARVVKGMAARRATHLVRVRGWGWGQG